MCVESGRNRAAAEQSLTKSHHHHQLDSNKPTEAGSEGGKAAPLFPMHKKGDNLFDLLGLCDYYGVGYKAARKWWAARYPDSYWIITKVKMTNTRPRTRRHVCVTCLFRLPVRMEESRPETFAAA